MTRLAYVTASFAWASGVSLAAAQSAPAPAATAAPAAAAPAPAPAATAPPASAALQPPPPSASYPPPGGYPPPGAYSQPYYPPPGGYAPPPQGAWYGGPYGEPAPGRPPEPEVRTANNALYIELLGAGYIYTVNYERTVSDFALRAGIGYIAVGRRYDEERESFLSVPLTATFIGLGSKRHMFEIGGGITIFRFTGGVEGPYVEDDYGEGERVVVRFTPVIGYRLQPPEGGFFLRAGLTPVMARDVILGIWPHVGLGATF